MCRRAYRITSPDLKGFRAYLIDSTRSGWCRVGPAGGGASAGSRGSRKRNRDSQPPVRTWRPTRPCSGRATISGEVEGQRGQQAYQLAAMHGPANISGNMRIVLDNDPPASTKAPPTSGS